MLVILFSIKYLKRHIEIYKTNFTKVNYTLPEKIFSDRDYVNAKENKFLQNTFLIKQKRHNQDQIVIETNKNFLAIRILCDKNDNGVYDQWKTIEENKVKIQGVSCEHTKIVFKEIPWGQLNFLSGGPISSDPLFLKEIYPNTNIYVKNYWVFYYK